MKKKKLTHKERGRLGGKKTSEKYGKPYMKMIAAKGGKNSRKKVIHNNVDSEQVSE